MAESFEFTSPQRGTFRIARDRGMWTASCDAEGLGEYNTAASALENLAGGSSLWPASGDPSEAGLPVELGQWTRRVS